jgi:hypothetical protein
VIQIGCVCANAEWLLLPPRRAPALPEEKEPQMSDTISSNERRLRRRVDDLWSRLQTAWLQIPLQHGAGRTSPTWEVFSERFDRCFRHVSLYVGRRVNDRESLECIVREALADNLRLFIEPCDAREEMRRLKASADRLIALGALIDPVAGTPVSGDERDDWARHHAITTRPVRG